jgi:hypothetical protein
MGFWTPSNPALNESLATSQGLLQSNFFMIQGVLGSSTLSAGITWAQGDVPYASGVQFVKNLAKVSASSMLTNYGTTNNPSWVPIANAFTNTTLTATVSGTLILANNISGAFTGIISSSAKILGSWVDKSASYGAQQAVSDGFVLVISGGGTNQDISAYSDSAADPTTKRGWIRYFNAGESNNASTITMPVKKNDYWKVVLDAGSAITVYWIPLGN